MRIFLLLFVGLSLLTSTAGYTDERSKKQQQLIQLKSKIKKLRKTIEVKENSRSRYIQQLRQIEKKIGVVSKNIRHSNLAVRVQQRLLGKLRQQKRHIQQQLAHQNDLLAQQIHTAYTLGQQEQLKLLFSQRDASKLQRNLTYYRYFSRFRSQQIERFSQSYTRLLSKEREISRAKTKLEDVLHQQQRQKTRLDHDRIQRKRIISTLAKELKKQGRYLGRLEENAKNLRQLIDSLSKILADTPLERNIKNFSRLRGKLSWPVKGQVKKMFGRRKPPSDLRWQGVVINAPRGNNVRAIAHGRVAFADWLRGMGNLIIIDHGNGYLSLYGHNESLFKAAGEWVDAGDVIASVGNSGGQARSGLYFEIRRKGKPQNPTRWCKASNWFRKI